ncbi:MAG: hypothetical protein ACLTTP_12020 [Alistipes ihumii]
MTEKKEIEPKAEATPSHRIRPIFKKDIRNPRLPLIHPSYCMFTEPITIITEEPADGKDHRFDLVVFDLIDGDRSATVETIAYEDLLLAHMAILFEDDREKFLRYQISIHTDPETWLEELRRFWINFEKENRTSFFQLSETPFQRHITGI